MPSFWEFCCWCAAAAASVLRSSSAHARFANLAAAAAPSVASRNLLMDITSDQLHFDIDIIIVMNIDIGKRWQPDRNLRLNKKFPEKICQLG